MSEEDNDKEVLSQRRAEILRILPTPMSNEERVRLQGELTVINAKIKGLNTAEMVRLKAVADQRKAAGLAEARANAARAQARTPGANTDDDEDDDPGQTAAIDAWITLVLQDSGVKVKRSRGELDFSDVPAKWLVVLQRLRAGIHALARGQELPEVEETSPKATRKR